VEIKGAASASIDARRTLTPSPTKKRALTVCWPRRERWIVAAERPKSENIATKAIAVDAMATRPKSSGSSSRARIARPTRCIAMRTSCVATASTPPLADLHPICD
jgi:hypothetical protein